MKTIHVALNNLGQITNDALYDVYAVLERNRGECTLDRRTLMRQLLDRAKAELRKAHVFVGQFNDGTSLAFTGARVAPYMTHEQLAAIALDLAKEAAA